MGLIIVLFIAAYLTTRSFVPQKNQSIQLVTLSEENKQILPIEKVVLVFSENLSGGNCSVSTTTPQTTFSTDIDTTKNTLSLTPDPVWPSPETINLTISCFSKTLLFSFTTKDPSNTQEELQVDLGSQIWYSKSREQYIKENSFISNFPIKRQEYVLLYIETKNLVYVSPISKTFTDEEKLKIMETERKELTAIGVPEEISIVFSY